MVLHSPLADGNWQKSYDFFHHRVAPELKGIPAVQDVAAVNAIPLSLGITEHSRYATRFGIVGRSFEPGRFPTAQIRWCTANYFHALGIPLIRGRLLIETDHNQPRYLINEAFARQFFPHLNPVAHKILMGVVDPHPQSSEIIGVVGNVREFRLTSAPEPTLYFLDISPEMDIVVKTAVTNAALESSISATLRRTNPQEVIGPVKTLNSYLGASLARQRFILALIATFAGLAVCLCIVGIYGVFSYSVTRRWREFGIRSAIGARRRDLLVQVVRECLAVILPGLLMGSGISLACSGLMRTLLYRVSPTDMLSSAIAVISVLILCLGSVMIPAWRAAQVDPATILHEQ